MIHHSFKRNSFTQQTRIIVYKYQTTVERFPMRHVTMQPSKRSAPVLYKIQTNCPGLLDGEYDTTRDAHNICV